MRVWRWIAGWSGVAKAIGATAALAAPAQLRRAIVGAAIELGRLVADAATTYPKSDVEILNASGASFHPLDLRHRACPQSDGGRGPAVPRLRRRRIAVADASVL
jgi:hypothetical protein